MAETKTDTIRELNDRFRKGDASVPGRIMITAGVEALVEGDEAKRAELFVAIRSFDKFTPGDDPHGEHDFAAFRFERTRLFWKIDYFDPTLEYGSEDPADITTTVRVLTIMLAEEY